MPLYFIFVIFFTSIVLKEQFTVFYTSIRDIQEDHRAIRTIGIIRYYGKMVIWLL